MCHDVRVCSRSARCLTVMVGWWAGHSTNGRWPQVRHLYPYTPVGLAESRPCSGHVLGVFMSTPQGRSRFPQTASLIFLTLNRSWHDLTMLMGIFTMTASLWNGASLYLGTRQLADQSSKSEHFMLTVITYWTDVCRIFKASMANTTSVLLSAHGIESHTLGLADILALPTKPWSVP